MQVSGIFTIRMSLRHFPFDAQDLHLLCRSKWRNDWVRFRRHPHPAYRSLVNLEYSSSLETEYFLDAMPQHKFEMQREDRHTANTRHWDGILYGYVTVKGQECEVCRNAARWPIPWHTDTRHGGSGKAYPMAPLCVTVARKPSYYLWNIVFPVFWVVSAAGVSMGIDGDDTTTVLDARMQVTLTVLLTLIAVKFVVASDLPNASYVTWLDAYILFGFFLIALVIIQNVIASRFEDETRATIDFVGLAIFGILWLGLHIGVFVYLYPRRMWRVLDPTAAQRSSDLRVKFGE
eukprot:m.44947 g.44947  ORF g.44947 m.44947 type:complete len:290 (-) comp13061_c0_seq1:939-1808(-)